MARPDSLGQFEQLVLTAILTLRDEAYGVTIHSKVQELARPKAVSLGAVYVTLDRLEDKGMVASWLSDPTPERGGRAKRCYRLEALGERALQELGCDSQAHVGSPDRGLGKGVDSPVGEGDRKMISGPSKMAEAIVGFFTPCACREEVLGDLYERYSSGAQYGFDAVRTIPLVILSRVRRTADPQVLLMQALAIYLSFVATAWLANRALLQDNWGLFRLALPAAMAILGLVLEDAYSKPGRRSSLKLVRGSAVGLGLALASQGVLLAGDARLSLPEWIVLYGVAMSILLSSAIRLLFPPPTDELQGANAPAVWLKQTGGEPAGVVEQITLIFRNVAAIAASLLVGAWMADRFALPKSWMITWLLLLVIGYQIWKRA
jgi:PadR family transcriptional regulator PadR